MIGIFKITEQGEKLVYKTEDPIQAREFIEAAKELEPKNRYIRKLMGDKR